MSILLETKRLIIKAPELDDFDNLYALQTDSEVMEYIGQGVRSEAEVRSGLEKAMAHQQKNGFSLGCVFVKDSGAVIGRAGLIYLAYDDRQPDIEVGYALMRNAWKKGYGSELAKALISWGFKELPVNKLCAVINPRNERSRRVLEKANMSYVGLGHYWGSEVALYAVARPMIDYQKIQLIPATLDDLAIIQNMARFYVYDISEYMGNDDGWQFPKNGLLECIDFKKYWQNANAFPFIVRYGNELVGFAIIYKKGSHSGIDFNMEKFLITKGLAVMSPISALINLLAVGK